MVLAVLEPLIPWIVGGLIGGPAWFVAGRLDLDMRVRYWRDIAQQNRRALPPAPNRSPLAPTPAEQHPEPIITTTDPRMEDAA